MGKKGNIAFVHYPHYPDSARVDTMPFAFNTLKNLAEAGWNIDLFLWESSASYASLFPENVRVLHQKDTWIPIVDSFLVRVSPEKYKENTYKYRFSRGKKYDCVFGLGQIGAFVAHVISKRNNAPLVLFNDEFPSAFSFTSWLEAEVKAAAHAKLIVVPDKARISELLKEYKLGKKEFVSLPNVSEFRLPAKKINWHERLKIPANSSICLNAGSVLDFAQAPELMMSVDAWPGNAVLVLNERNKASMQKLRQYYAHLERKDKIFWVEEDLSEEMLNSLVAFSRINFGLYRNAGKNIELIGFSSGKLMRSIAAGVPVIASDLPSLDFIRDHRLGKLVKHPAEIGSAINEIFASKEDYASNCSSFYNEHCRFDNYWEGFCRKMHAVAGIMIN